MPGVTHQGTRGDAARNHCVLRSRELLHQTTPGDQQEATSQLIRGVREGKLKHRETIVEGLENAPAALNQLFDGSNIGKLMVKVVE